MVKSVRANMQHKFFHVLIKFVFRRGFGLYVYDLDSAPYPSYSRIQASGPDTLSSFN